MEVRGRFVSGFSLACRGLREWGRVCKAIGQITPSCSWGAVSGVC